jgi:hypothetical protein
MTDIVTKIAKIEDTVQVQARLVALQPELAKGKVFECVIKPFREKRSLDANAYFHVLVEKIAKALKCGADEMKVKMNLEYGTMEDIDGEKVAIALPKKTDATKFYPYAKWVNDFTSPKGKPMSQYYLYKRTSDLDRKEMAELIDGVVEEAKGLGIETKTPAEIAEMMSLWGTK